MAVSSEGLLPVNYILCLKCHSPKDSFYAGCTCSLYTVLPFVTRKPRYCPRHWKLCPVLPKIYRWRNSRFNDKPIEENFRTEIFGSSILQLNKRICSCFNRCSLYGIGIICLDCFSLRIKIKTYYFFLNHIISNKEPIKFSKKYKV